MYVYLYFNLDRRSKTLKKAKGRKRSVYFSSYINKSFNNTKCLVFF